MKRSDKRKKNSLKIAQGHSFDLNMPYVPGGRTFDGVQNATPEMLRKLKKRKEKNTGGQELPGFLRQA
jgi:hypothetical protein